MKRDEKLMYKRPLPSLASHSMEGVLAAADRRPRLGLSRDLDYARIEWTASPGEHMPAEEISASCISRLPRHPVGSLLSSIASPADQRNAVLHNSS